MYSLKKMNPRLLICRRNSIFWICLLFLSACSFEPPYRVPPTCIPEKWKGAQEFSPESCCVENWWEIFDDPYLNELEQIAVANNKDLDVAVARVLEERASAGIHEADLFPQVNLTSNYNNSGSLIKIFGLPPTNPPIPSIIRVHQLLYTLQLNLRYELDIWGRLRNEYKGALLNLESQIMAYETTLLAITTDLATQYFQLRSLDAQLDLLKSTIDARKSAVDINMERYKGSFINYTDVSRAQVLFYNAEYEYLDVLRQRTLKENMIAVLLGIPASDLEIPHMPLEKDPPIIPAGIPSDILLKRPDIKEAERKAASENALIGSAYASFFPSISLTTDLGFSSPVFKDFLKWSSRYWAYGANLREPLFDGWRNLSNLDLAKARFKQASADYQQKVIEGFRDVENALANIKLQAEEMESLGNSIKAAEITRELSNIRYFKGLVNYLEVTESERSELEVKRTYVDLLGWRYASTIQLIKALGGCW